MADAAKFINFQGNYVEPQELKILVIDDDESYLESLKTALQYQGYKNISTASTLAAATEIIKKGDYQIVITDVDFENSKENGGDFILDNPSLLNHSNAAIITGHSFDQIPNLEELQNRDIEIIDKASGLESILEFIKKNYEKAVQESNQTVNNTALPNSTSNSTQSSQISNEGLSAHIASDLWTTEDALGYEDYAYAIYRFMTHPKTRPPLTISIQAPWGGGKTSLMRIVRKFIDPEADSRMKEAAKNPSGELKLIEALNEIKKWIDEKTNRKPLEVEDKQKLENKNPEAKNLTIWFNAWKYENTNQVWAGLIDAIMQQVAARLPVKERELFWLRLNLKRIDTEKIRKKVHERIFNYFWRGLYFWIFGLGFALIFSALVLGATWLADFGYKLIWGTGVSAMTICTVVVTVLKYLKAKSTVENEPAAVSLNEYLEIPNYSAETGFIHRAEIDLKRVLESISEKYKPLVVFIDDLDRCSPTKISQVVEAVNLFLAGDFPNCMFIIGMDTEMVAAALQSAHKDMIANLPTDLGIPIGWRFMDKFVQLPFLIPPNQRFTKNYIDSLFVLEDTKSKVSFERIETKIMSLVQKGINNVPSDNVIEQETKRLIKGNEISEVEVPYFQKGLRQRLGQMTIDEGVKNFSDRNKEIRELMDKQKCFDHFIGNPRELKRFINAFRFNYFLWWAQRLQSSEAFSLEQLLRWTILSMKWAEVVRWLRRGGGSEWETIQKSKKVNEIKTELVTRLNILEKISKESQTFSEWQTNVVNKFNIDLKATCWLNDEDLYQFFRKECNFEEGERLSDGIGKGLW